MSKLILVETKETFELFEVIEEAFNYCKEVKNVKRIDLVDCNEDNIYHEVIDNKNTLNYYEDNNNLIKQGILSDVY